MLEGEDDSDYSENAKPGSESAVVMAFVAKYVIRLLDWACT